MKLTEQTSQYWANLESFRDLEESIIVTWKLRLNKKYLSPTYYPRLLDKWNQFYQGNKSAKEYVVKFDEFLIQCNTLETETPI